MKNMKKIALMLAVCMTAFSYAACGAENADYTSNWKGSTQDALFPDEYADNGVDHDFAMEGAIAETAPEAVQDELPNDEAYSEITENAFISTADQPTSTFSIDVDTASYANVRRMIQNGTYDNIPDAVRIEEMINYFHYDYPEPEENIPFSVTTELSPCPWNEQNQLMLIGLQAKQLDLTSRVPMNLVFLIDVSGSMYGEDRLGLVQKALTMLSGELNENDRISIVTYAGFESVVLEGASGADTSAIVNAIEQLESGGSTAGEAGIKKAYEIAEKYFIPDGNNRILLATDGDLNVGISSAEELKALVEEKRESGVNLSVLGFGYGNLKDVNLETLADNGNGNYAYIDSELEAKKVLVQEMGGTLYTVAKDVKLQLAFDPETVQSYRLIGYENRVLANEDFENDAVDAGEIGAGHSVTALYELVPNETESDHLFKLSMRYKEPDGVQSLLKETDVSTTECYSEQRKKNSSFAAAVAEFGMLLKNSNYAGNACYQQIQQLLSESDLQDEFRIEFSDLADMACAEGLIPEESSVLSENQTIPEESFVSSGNVTAYANGNAVDFPEPEKFKALVELYADQAQPVETVPEGVTLQNAINGIYVVLDNMRFFITDDGDDLMIIDQQKLSMPEIIRDELIRLLS